MLMLFVSTHLAWDLTMMLVIMIMMIITMMMIPANMIAF